MEGVFSYMLVVMLKLRDRMTAGTPDFQLGGLAQKRPTVIHLYNMRKCFDQVNL